MGRIPGAETAVQSGLVHGEGLCSYSVDTGISGSAGVPVRDRWSDRLGSSGDGCISIRPFEKLLIKTDIHTAQDGATI